MANKFKKNDQVVIISGSNKGKIGRLISIRDDRVVVEGINLATIHKKQTSTQSSAILKVEKSIHISNVSLTENNRPVKVAIKVDLEDSINSTGFNRKIRVSKKTGKRID